MGEKEMKDTYMYEGENLEECLDVTRKWIQAMEYELNNNVLSIHTISIIPSPKKCLLLITYERHVEKKEKEKK